MTEKQTLVSVSDVVCHSVTNVTPGYDDPIWAVDVKIDTHTHLHLSRQLRALYSNIHN